MSRLERMGLVAVLPPPGRLFREPVDPVGAPHLGYAKAWRVENRNLVLYVRWWLWPLAWLWHRRWAPVAALVNRGYLWPDSEAGFYRTARPAWYWRRKVAEPWFDHRPEWMGGRSYFDLARSVGV